MYHLRQRRNRELSSSTSKEPIKVQAVTFSYSDLESKQPSDSNASQERTFLFPLLFASPSALRVAKFKESEGRVDMLGCR